MKLYKFLLPFFIIFIYLFLKPNFVEATELNLNNKTFILPDYDTDTYQYNTILSFENDTRKVYFFAYSKNYFYDFTTNSGTSRLKSGYFSNSSSYGFINSNFYSCYISTDKSNDVTTIDFTTCTDIYYNTSLNSMSPLNPSPNFIFTNSDIYDIKFENNKYKKDKLVFQQPPQPIQEVEEVEKTLILQTATTSTDFSQVMEEILKILPTVLLVVISALALRKAIKLVLTILAQA